MQAFGEPQSRFDNRIVVDPVVCDAWGIPVARVEFAYSQADLDLSRQMTEAVEEAARLAKIEIRERSGLAEPGLSCHEIGTARMGSDARTSVLNAFNQTWDIPNLFVADGSCFVNASVVNPTLTMMAIALRAGEYLARKLVQRDC